MMRLLTLSCILILLAGSPASAEKAVSRILCFGDSITDYGQWVETVGKHPRFETIITQPLLQKLETDYEAKGVRFLSLLKVVSPKNFKDGLHPNEAGDAEIAAAVLLALTQK